MGLKMASTNFMNPVIVVNLFTGNCSNGQKLIRNECRMTKECFSDNSSDAETTDRF